MGPLFTGIIKTLDGSKTFSTTEAPTETMAPTSTEAPTETVIASTTEAPTETMAPTSTEAPTETVIASTTEAPTETMAPTNTDPRVTIPVFTKPAVETTIISHITPNSAISGVNIISNGGTAIASNGIIWNTVTGPTTALTTKTTNGSGTMTGLKANTTYYVRAYATNSVGTAYGNEISFTTSRIPITATLLVTGTTNV
ncbi:MAG: hypothetical protein WCK88_04275 [bacterium]